MCYVHKTRAGTELQKNEKKAKIYITEPFYYQLMHIMLKNTELLKHSKITFTQCTIHTPYRSQYAAIALTTPCTSFMQILLTNV